MPDYKYKSDYASSLPARQFGDQGLILYALALKYDIDDIFSLASSSLTDQTDDKGIDALHFVEDEKTAIIVQGYMASDETRSEAPSSKASALNTAISWALSIRIEEVPQAIRANVKDLREAITLGDVTRIEFWVVHNLDESTNMRNELDAVEATAKSLLEKYFKEKTVFVVTKEVGNHTLESWYRNKMETIMVNDVLEIELEFSGYEIQTGNWKAFDTTVSLQWIKDLFEKYKEELFSANIRGYLGSVAINNAIKNTCTTEPDNFWIYNNGLTCLTHDFKYDDDNKKLRLLGISVINGAQTTGAVGSVEMSGEGFLPIRFVSSKDREIWRSMILYNNSQNRIYSSDFRSNDEVQKRLREEFKSIPETDYTGRRGGAEDIIKRKPNEIGTEKAAISLVAFHDNPNLTYHKKKEIWNDENYRNYFNSDLTAKHLVFTYSLYVAIEKKKEELRKTEQRTGLQEEEYEFLTKRGGKRLYLAAIGQSLEEILGEQITNPKRLSFGNISWKQAAKLWKDVVEKTIMFSNQLRPGIDNGILKEEYVKSSISDFKRMIASQVASEPNRYDLFREKIKYD